MIWVKILQYHTFYIKAFQLIRFPLYFSRMIETKTKCDPFRIFYNIKLTGQFFACYEQSCQNTGFRPILGYFQHKAVFLGYSGIFESACYYSLSIGWFEFGKKWRHFIPRNTLYWWQKSSVILMQHRLWNGIVLLFACIDIKISSAISNIKVICTQFDFPPRKKKDPIRGRNSITFRGSLNWTELPIGRRVAFSEMAAILFPLLQ